MPTKPGRPTVPTDPDLIAWAVGEKAKGRTSREIAKEAERMGYPVAHMTVERWWKKSQEAGEQAADRPEGQRSTSSPIGAPGESPARFQAPVAPPPPAPPPNALAQVLAEKRERAAAQAAAQPPAPEIDASDTLGTLRALAADMLRQASAEKLSNPKLSATLTRSTSDVMNTIARVEKTTAEASDLIRFSRKELHDGAVAALERFKAICERPLHCARCARELSVEWGEAHAKIADVPPGK